MKTRLILLALPCLLLGACTGSGNKTAQQKIADSLAAKAHMDSLMGASRMMHKQDSIDAAKKDTAKKTDTAGVKK